MFTVQGWNVFADKLKTQTEKPKKNKRKDKKRKEREERREDVKPTVDRRRSGEPSEDSPIDRGAIATATIKPQLPEKKRKLDKSSKSSSNDGEVERPSKKAKSGGKTERAPNNEVPKQHNPSNRTQAKAVRDDEPQRPKKTKKGKKERMRRREQQAPVEDVETALLEEYATANEASVAPPSTLKLTPLQSAMRAKLMGSRFRYLNESLYTKPSSESVALFKQNPNFFNEYHAGFRQQVSSWPENPVDSFFDELQQRGKPAGGVEGPRALPRTAGVCRVADLGCGDASLAKKAKAAVKASRIQVDNYDLHSTEPFVVKADIAKLPVADDTVNIAVLCLALMGTNWIEFIEEAWRVLHWKGELWVAEIKSRFSRTQRKPPDHSVGKKRKPNKQALKLQKQQAEQEETQRTIAELDGNAEPKQTTDVSGFVAVLEKRGFGLADDNAIDLSNKMFVRMKFVKNRPPVKGKHAGQGAKKKNWREMLREGEDDGVDEAAILQPCLYKLR